MCAAIICYLFLVEVPTATGFERHISLVESREECVMLRAAWFAKWADEDLEFGKPQLGCMRTVNI
jgi:hypothetical protein